SEGYAAGHTAQTHNGQPSDPRSQVQPVGQTVDGQILPDRPLGGVTHNNFTPTEISGQPIGQTNQTTIPPSTSVFDRIFPVTLAAAAQQWYFKLPPRRFNLWNAFSLEFHAQFSFSRQLPSHLEDLVEGLTEEGRLAATLRGIKPLGELWKDIKRLTVGSMAEFLDRPDGFIKLEEAVWCVDTVGQKKSQQRTTLAGTSTQSPQYPGSSNMNGKMSNNGNRQGNGKEGKFTDNAEHHPRENAP
uniref:Retrotransposon gag domain-containing protein n=1 Tax=Cannabis sativa TaxID=3483 RepID=A0A803P9K8_CANSA